MRKEKFWTVLGLLGAALILFGSTASCVARPPVDTRQPVLTPTYPFFPMFTLTTFPPTATPEARPIPPLPEGAALPTPSARPAWMGAVSPPNGSTVSLAAFEGICIQVASDGFFFDQFFPALETLFRAKEPLRRHLYLTVNDMVPSELTWQDVVIPNSTHPGTAWPGVRTQKTFRWPAEIAVGRYRVTVFYPTETGPASFSWHFETTE